MKRVLAVCTRVAAEPESRDDEYCRQWDRTDGDERSHPRLGTGGIALVVLRGCAFFKTILAGNVDKALEDLKAELLRQLASLRQGPCELVLAVHKGGEHRPEMPPESLHWNHFFSQLGQITLAPHRLRSIGEYGRAHPIWTSLSESDENLEAIFTGAIALYPYRGEFFPTPETASHPEMVAVAPGSQSTAQDRVVESSRRPKHALQPVQLRWSTLKHDIVRQFLAFDTDLQVWEEHGYGDEAAKNTIALYQGTLLRRFDRARALLYSDPNAPSTDCIADVIQEAAKDLPPDITIGVSSLWQELNLLFPPPDTGNERIDAIVHQLRKADEGDFEPLKKGMQGASGFRFCDWNHDLSDSLFRIEYLLLARRSFPGSERVRLGES